MIQYNENNEDILRNIKPWKLLKALLGWPISKLHSVFEFLRTLFFTPIFEGWGKDTKFAPKLMEKIKKFLDIRVSDPKAITSAFGLLINLFKHKWLHKVLANHAEVILTNVIFYTKEQ